MERSGGSEEQGKVLPRRLEVIKGRTETCHGRVW